MGKPRGIGEKIIEMRNNGMSYYKISHELNCSTATISYHCKEGTKEIVRNRTKKYRDDPNGSRAQRKIWKCETCKKRVRCGRKNCTDCRESQKEASSNITLKEACYKTGHKCNTYTKIRERARRFALELGWNSCKNCGYEKHIEICHIKSISSFSEDAKLSEINSKNNLLALCPNCHWEFDNSLLTLEQINTELRNRAVPQPPTVV